MVQVRFCPAIGLRSMKIKEIMETTAGGIATVATPLGEPLYRNPSIYGQQKPVASKKKKKETKKDK